MQALSESVCGAAWHADNRNGEGKNGNEQIVACKKKRQQRDGSNKDQAEIVPCKGTEIHWVVVSLKE